MHLLSVRRRDKFGTCSHDCQRGTARPAAERTAPSHHSAHGDPDDHQHDDHVPVQPGRHVFCQLAGHGRRGGCRGQFLTGQHHHDRRLVPGGRRQQLHRPASGRPAGSKGLAGPLDGFFHRLSDRDDRDDLWLHLHGPAGPAARRDGFGHPLFQRLRQLHPLCRSVHGGQFRHEPVSALGRQRGLFHDRHGFGRDPEHRA